VQVPQEGLIEVPHDSAEYWDVVEQFKKPPNPETAQGNSDRKGMHDAWWEDRLLFLSNVSCHIDSKRSFCPDRLGTNTTKVEQRLFSAGTRVTKLQRIQSELALDPSAQKDNDTTNHKSSPFRLFLQLLLTSSGMHHSRTQAMSDAVDNAEVMLSCITRKYKESASESPSTQ
jgi:hypothetical protein